ncbi:MAG: hypothetical protein MKZ94_13345 [Pirellulales bacterium]|nr:hypothetical protein [Pirellulales bacterium]
MKRQLSGILAIAFLLLPFTLIAQDETPASTAPVADTAATKDETAGQTTEDADSNSVVASDEVDQSEESGEDSAADKHWILTPYQIRIWLAVDASPQLQALDASAVSRRVNALVDNWVGAGWDLQIEVPPRKVYTDLLYNFDDLGILDIAALYEPLPEKKEAKIRAVQYDKEEESSDEVEEVEPEVEEEKPRFPIEKQKLITPNLLRQLDKIYATSLRYENGVYELGVAEFDTNARVRVLTAKRSFRNLETLPAQIFSCLKEVFSPIAQVDYNGVTDGKTARIKIRAAAMVADVEAGSPIMMQKGDVLRPVVRKNDRSTQAPEYDGVIEVTWTYMYINDLTVQEDEDLGVLRTNGNGKGQVISTFTMLRNPIAARRNTLQEKYGLLVRPVQESSLLKIVANDRENYTLQGYNVYAKSPKIDPEAEGDAPTLLIGQTDWRGAIEVTQDIFQNQGTTKLVVIYVRNGQQVLARLPIVPGYRALEEVKLPNDDYRLQYEAFFVGFQNSILDYTVQQAVYKIRIEHHINKDEEEKARKLLKELSKVPSAVALNDVLSKREASLQDDPNIDANTKRKIEGMFEKTRKLINEYLQGNDVEGNVLVKMESAVRAKFGDPPAPMTP